MLTRSYEACSQPYCAEVARQWFPIIVEPDGEFAVGPMTPAEELYVTTLRREFARRAWRQCLSVLLRDYYGPLTNPIVAILNVRRDFYGAAFDGQRLECDAAWDQLYYLERPATNLRLDAQGSAKDMGIQAAAWFHARLRRR
jgi:hypothetical protein